jgi:hypothetical protein
MGWTGLKKHFGIEEQILRVSGDHTV